MKRNQGRGDGPRGLPAPEKVRPLQITLYRPAKSKTSKVRTADVVITGEGRLDRQTLEGKAPAGVAQMARKNGKKIYAIVGQASADQESCGFFDGVFNLARPPLTVEHAMTRTAELLRARAFELASTLEP